MSTAGAAPSKGYKCCARAADKCSLSLKLSARIGPDIHPLPPATRPELPSFDKLVPGECDVCCAGSSAPGQLRALCRLGEALTFLFPSRIDA